MCIFYSTANTQTPQLTSQNTSFIAARYYDCVYFCYEMQFKYCETNDYNEFFDNK